MPSFRRQAWLSWASIALLGVLCTVLAILQYRWIGAITEAERGRLHDELQSRLSALRATFNDELSKSFFALMANAEMVDRDGREAAYSAQYARWRETHDHMFRRMGL